MAGFIEEFFGYRAEDKSKQALDAAQKQLCPFLRGQCTKILSRDHTLSGVCAVRQKKDGTPAVICCPNRIYAEDYRMLHEIAADAFGAKFPLYAGRAAVGKAKTEGGAVAVFGHGRGGELRLPQRGHILWIGFWPVWIIQANSRILRLLRCKLLIRLELIEMPGRHFCKIEVLSAIQWA